MTTQTELNAAAQAIIDRGMAVEADVLLSAIRSITDERDICSKLAGSTSVDLFSTLRERDLLRVACDHKQEVLAGVQVVLNERTAELAALKSSHDACYQAAQDGMALEAEKAGLSKQVCFYREMIDGIEKQLGIDASSDTETIGSVISAMDADLKELFVKLTTHMRISHDEIQKRKAAEARIEQLEVALRYYANPDHWASLDEVSDQQQEIPLRTLVDFTTNCLDHGWLVAHNALSAADGRKQATHGEQK